jgi:hypothetical protein
VARALLTGAGAAADWLPNGKPLSSRINRNISDMIGGDHAVLYKIPRGGETTGSLGTHE